MLDAEGEPFVATLPRTLTGGPAAPGDVLEVVGEPALARSVAPRRSVLARGVSRGGTRVIAANADLLLVVASAVDPEPSAAFIDRYLAAGELGGLSSALVITKTDLAHDAGTVRGLIELYRGIGYSVEVGSAIDPALATAILELVGGRLAVLAGHSGVGKSTLTEALTGTTRARGAVSEKARTGRHTTTDPRLIPLAGGGGIIDTAGVRTFHLAPTDDRTLADGFPEIAAAGEGCRFRGCRHAGDAGCAVDGRVSESRLESYRGLIGTD